ncbi:hypothetical protein V1477_021245 [Vespula maculifrons]|uniref:Uncharacterized protein n=1 Tax=Vespula maculifrons TaxID=7453 RepID=A0ABD2AH88_VESMC
MQSILNKGFYYRSQSFWNESKKKKEDKDQSIFIDIKIINYAFINLSHLQAYQCYRVYSKIEQ